jgi:hypothetical protein
MTNNYLQNITQKTRDLATRTHLKQDQMREIYTLYAGAAGMLLHINGKVHNVKIEEQEPKYTLKKHVCYFVFMAWILYYLYSLHQDFYTLENMINIET